jgi:hypothetical protein
MPRVADDRALEDLVDLREQVGVEHLAGGRGVVTHLLGRVAPTIAELTLGLASTQAIASWASVRPASSASGLSRWTRSRTLSSM